MNLSEMHNITLIYLFDHVQCQSRIQRHIVVQDVVNHIVVKLEILFLEVIMHIRIKLL